MANKKEGSEFIVKLDGLKLSKESEARINKEIRTAVLREIAGIDTGGDFSARIPFKEWLGIWLRKNAFEVDRPGQKEIILEVNEVQR